MILIRSASPSVACLLLARIHCSCLLLARIHCSCLLLARIHCSCLLLARIHCLGCFPHPPSASNIAPEIQVCKDRNKDVSWLYFFIWIFLSKLNFPIRSIPQVGRQLAVRPPLGPKSLVWLPSQASLRSAWGYSYWAALRPFALGRHDF